MNATNHAHAVAAIFFFLVSISNATHAQVEVPDKCDGLKAELERDKVLSPMNKEKLRASSFISHTFIWENDSFAAGGDHHYTNGMKYAWLHNPCRYEHEGLKSKYRELLGKFFRGPFSVHSGGLVGMNMYTPNVTETAQRIRSDRPYAGWVYAGISLHATRSNDQAVGSAESQKDDHVLELQLGFTGPKTLQREAQEYIHRNLTSSNISQGWDNQIEQRLGANALYLFRRNFQPQSWLRIVPHAGFSLGNLIQFGNAGAMLLVGKSANEYPGTTIQPLGTDLKLLSEVSAIAAEVPGRTAYSRFRPKPVFYGFLGLDARYVASSIFVEGTGDSAHDIDLVHGVYDLIAGIAWGTHSYRFSYKIINRSKEFESSDPTVPKSHRFGQFSLTWFY